MVGTKNVNNQGKANDRFGVVSTKGMKITKPSKNTDSSKKKGK